VPVGRDGVHVATPVRLTGAVPVAITVLPFSTVKVTLPVVWPLFGKEITADNVGGLSSPTTDDEELTVNAVAA
jgi:hypothetical protein